MLGLLLTRPTARTRSTRQLLIARPDPPDLPALRTLPSPNRSFAVRPGRAHPPPPPAAGTGAYACLRDPPRPSGSTPAAGLRSVEELEQEATARAPRHRLAGSASAGRSAPGHPLQAMSNKYGSLLPSEVGGTSWTRVQELPASWVRQSPACSPATQPFSRSTKWIARPWTST